MKTPQDAFLNLVLEQLSQGHTEKKFLEKLNALFVLVPTQTPQYLKSIDSTLTKSSLKPQYQKILDNKLKTAWYTVWKEGKYKKNHEKEFLRFYPQLTQPQQQTLKDIFDHKNIQAPISSQNSKSINVLSLYNAQLKKTKNLDDYLANIQQLDKLKKEQAVGIIKNIDVALGSQPTSAQESPQLIKAYHFLMTKAELSFFNLNNYCSFSQQRNFSADLFMFSPENFKPLYEKILKNTLSYDNTPIDLTYCANLFDSTQPLPILFLAYHECQQTHTNSFGEEEITFSNQKFFNFLDNFELIDPQNLKSLFKNTKKSMKSVPQPNEHLLLLAWEKIAQKGANKKIINKTFNTTYLDLEISEEEFCQKLTQACQIYADKRKLEKEVSVPTPISKNKSHFKI